MVPFQILQDLGCSVEVVFPGKNIGDKFSTAIHDFERDQEYSEKLGHNFSLNANFEDVMVENYDALVFPGGCSSKYMALNEKVLSIVNQFEEKIKFKSSDNSITENKILEKKFWYHVDI